MIKKLYKIILLFSLSPLALMSHDLHIYVTKSCAIDKIESATLKYIFLSKRHRINHKHIIPLKAKNIEEEELFSTYILKKKPSSLKHYWTKMTFTNRGTEPSVIQDFESIDNNTCYVTYSTNIINSKKWKSIQIE